VGHEVCITTLHMLIRSVGLRALLAVAIAVPMLVIRTDAGNQAVMLTLADSALPSAVGANGSMVVGSFRSGGGFYWMPTTGVVFVGGKGVSSVSRDGKTIVGTAFDQRMSQAAIWLRGAEWKVLGSIAPNALPCDDLLSSALGSSADGKVIVGLAWNTCDIARAFRWEESTGMVDLGSTVAGRSSRANGVSGSGKVVVGWQEDPTGPRRGARWVEMTPKRLCTTSTSQPSTVTLSIVSGAPMRRCGRSRLAARE
jgi:probable HAF family extracellular repeat protein